MSDWELDFIVKADERIAFCTSMAMSAALIATGAYLAEGIVAGALAAEAAITEALTTPVLVGEMATAGGGAAVKGGQFAYATAKNVGDAGTREAVLRAARLAGNSIGQTVNNLMKNDPDALSAQGGMRATIAREVTKLGYSQAEAAAAVEGAVQGIPGHRFYRGTVEGEILIGGIMTGSKLPIFIIDAAGKVSRGTATQEIANGLPIQAIFTEITRQ